MLALVGKLFGWIGSGLVSAFGNSVLQPILKTIQNGQDANRSVAENMIQGEIAANNVKAIIAPSFKLLIYLTAAPAVIHWWGVVADSLPVAFQLGWTWTFPFVGSLVPHAVGSWKVAALPDAYTTIQTIILTAFFVSSPLTTLAKAGAAALLKR